MTTSARGSRLLPREVVKALKVAQQNLNDSIPLATALARCGEDCTVEMDRITDLSERIGKFLEEFAGK